MSITQERLKEILHYDPETGAFTWRVDRGSKKFKGLKAGCLRSFAVNIVIDKIQYKAHRLAWLYMTGSFPTEFIDHIDRDPTNNKWNNLRAASCQQNAYNQGPNSKNSTGVKGVSWDCGRQRWKVQVNGAPLSRHKCLLDAISTAYRHQKTIHGEFANHQ